MFFGHVVEQCALYSIGKVDSNEINTAFSAGLAELLAKYFGVAGDRYYVNFIDMERHQCGFKAATFAPLS